MALNVNYFSAYSVGNDRQLGLPDLGAMGDVNTLATAGTSTPPAGTKMGIFQADTAGTLSVSVDGGASVDIPLASGVVYPFAVFPNYSLTWTE